MKRFAQAACALLVVSTPALARDMAAILRPTPVFATPSPAGETLGMANQLDGYAVMSRQGEWVEIQYSERKGWVAALDVEVREAALRRTTAMLRVRTGPGLERTILALLPPGTWVVERGGTGDWRQISFRGESRWVHGDYLESEREAEHGRGYDTPDQVVQDRAVSRPEDLSKAWLEQDEQRAGDRGQVPLSAQQQQQAPGRVPDRTAVFESTTNAGARNQMQTGTIRVNGRDYTFRSGGYGRGNLPPGEYRVTPHMWNRSDRSMSVGGEGYSFALSDAYDPRTRARRSLLRIHPDGGVQGTEGCIGIVGDAATQRQFRDDMREELRRNGGSYTLTVR